MFGFFRRQTKKKCKNQSASKFINDIQCVPVDKYEINFCKVANKERNAPRSEAKSKPPRIMGNSESNATKKADDIVAIVYPKTGSSNFNNNVDEMTPKNSPIERRKDVTKCDGARDSKKEAKLANHVRRTEAKVFEEPKAIPNEHVAKLTDRGHDCVLYSPANISKCEEKEKRPLTGDTQMRQTELAHRAERYADERLLIRHTESTNRVEKLDERSLIGDTRHTELTNQVEKYADESDSSQSSRVNENRTDTITRRWREDISTSSDDATATNDESSKQRAMNASRDETDGQEMFGTAPSSPTNEDVVNQTEKNAECQSAAGFEVNVKAARNNFFSSLQNAPKEVEAKNAEGRAERSTETSSYTRAERDDFSRSNSVRTSSQMDPPSLTDDTSLASDTIDTSMDETSRSEDDEFEESENKVEIFKKAIQKKIVVPGGATGNRNSRSTRIRIPDITITESSDSEGENDTDGEYDEMEGHHDNCYERTFPSILYDITEVDEPFSDASDMDNSLMINNEK